MTPMLGKENRYIIDANVLIDYKKANSLSLLPLFAQNYGELFVSSLTPEGEVCDLYYEDCEILGLGVIEPEPDQVAQCSAIGGISFPDAVNWILARDYELILITNDKPLWQAAKTAGIRFIRGLRILLRLVECGSLKEQKALTIAETIRRMDPRFINGKVMHDFRKELYSLKVGKSRKRKTSRSDSPEGSRVS